MKDYPPGLKSEVSNTHNVIEDEVDRPLLDHALVPTRHSMAFVSANFLKILLGYRSDSNKYFNGNTPWNRSLPYLDLAKFGHTGEYWRGGATFWNCSLNIAQTR